MPRGQRVTTEEIRDVLVELQGGPFVLADISFALGVSDQTVKKHFDSYFIPRNKVQPIGKDGRQTVYQQVIPREVVTERPRRPAVEEEVARQYATPRARRSQISGTGKRKNRVGNPEVDALLGDVRAAGGEVKKDGGHFKVFKSGKFIGPIPSSPSDGRGLLNVRSDLRKAGLALP